MKRLFILTALLCLAVSAGFGQKRKRAAKTAPQKQLAAAAAAAPEVAEIPAADWSAIVNALDKEDWTQAALLCSLSFGKLKTDNDKKQLAQLRYFYIYALAGDAARGKIPYTELERVVKGFIGKEFLMPSRQFLADCKSNVNYICPVAGNDKALRVTATNKSASAIHAFEYVQMAEKVDVAENNGKRAFLGGNLQKAEINLYKSNLRIMRLIFDKGFVNIVSSR